MAQPPPERVLHSFGVGEPCLLGGRVRRHWSVRRRDETLVLTRYTESEGSLRYEIEAVRATAAGGWPVPVPIDGPRLIGGRFWTLAAFLKGEPLTGPDEPRHRGRLLARFHEGLQGLPSMGTRPGFRRAERALSDPRVERTFAERERTHPAETTFVRWHWERARKRLDGIDLAARPGRLLHGDFTGWNLRFDEGRLSAILDFELAREDHRVAEFFHAWRGKYDAVVLAYHEVLPLEPIEWEILTPLWWLFLVDLWCGSPPNDPWILSKLRQRSPLMGPDRDASP